jgi:hypothetical protein
MSPLSTQSPFTFRTILIYAIVIVVAVIFVAYVLFQARFLLAGPQIFVQQIPATQSERLIELEGQARNIVRITLNGRQIYTDKAGYFKEALVLENGYTIATLEAEDRYGRKTSRTESFVYIDTQEKNDEGIN